MQTHITRKIGLVLTSIVLSLIITISSCLKKEDFEFDKLLFPDWEPNFSLPLIKSTLDLRKILNETEAGDMFIEDANHFLTLVYKAKLMSLISEETFEIVNQNFTNNHNFSVPSGFSIGDSTTFTYTDNIVFVNSNNEILDTLYLKSGRINFQLNTTLNHNANIRIILPTVRKNGIPFIRTINYVFTGSPTPINLNFNVEDYIMVFHHTGGTFNQLQINYEVTVYNNLGAPDMSPYNVETHLNFQDLQYSKMFGFLNYKEYFFPVDTLGIGIFKNSWFGNFLLEDPRLIVKISNSYGFPLNIEFDHLIATNPNTPVSTSVSGLPNPLIVAPPAYPGDVALTTFTLDKNNSNIKSAINNMPHYLHYLFTGYANPTGLYAPNFVLDTSAFVVDIELEMPLFGRAWDFVIEDTIDFKFENVDEIVYANFKINIINGFPIDANIQIYFADSTYNILDSLFSYTQEVILAAPAGPAPDYRVINPRHKYTEANLSAARLQNISNSKYMFIRSTLATINNGADIMKIYSDYNIDLRMAVQVQLKVNPNDL